MKRFIRVSKLVIPVIVLCLSFSKPITDFLQTLEITRDDAENSVYYSFSGGYFNYPYTVLYQSLPVSTRVTLVTEIGAFAKAYTRSKAFENRYLEERNSIKPTPPEPPKSAADLRNEYRKTLQESIENAQSGLNNYSGDIRKGMEDMINNLKEQIKQLDEPDNPMFGNEMDAVLQEGYKQQVSEYERRLKEWAESYPESTDWMIRDRLNYFLELSETVDFNAKLEKSKYGQMVFINPDYENMPSDWKLVFRAGRESVEAARKLASQWLQELN
jgi:hypothetical protein